VFLSTSAADANLSKVAGPASHFSPPNARCSPWSPCAPFRARCPSLPRSGGSLRPMACVLAWSLSGPDWPLSRHRLYGPFKTQGLHRVNASVRIHQKRTAYKGSLPCLRRFRILESTRQDCPDPPRGPRALPAVSRALATRPEPSQLPARRHVNCTSSLHITTRLIPPPVVWLPEVKRRPEIVPFR
jgi:hypothetical protein